MKLRSVNADGSQNTETEFDLDLVDPDGRPYEYPVSVRCRMVPEQVRKDFERKGATWVKNQHTRGMVQQVDWQEVTNLTVCWAVLSWEGVFGADDKPLVCTDATKRELPNHAKLQIVERVATTEAARATAASFREPASVV